MSAELLTSARFAAIERRTAALMHTRHDTIVMPGEALLPLEAAIKSAASAGTTALNIITGPYGQTFGGWLRDAGAQVIDLAVPFTRAVTPNEVADALAAHPEISFVSLVHAEAATGNTNPIGPIAELVRTHGALLYLDAVASVGAEPLLTDDWGVDLCVIGPQKALGGPSGVSAVSISPRAWERMAGNPAAPRRSFLSLLDWKERWFEAGRTAVPPIVPPLETLALEAALTRIEAEGEDALMARHRAAAAAVREGASVLGAVPYVVRDADAAPVATTLAAPAGTDATELVKAALAADPTAPLVAGGGTLATTMFRVNHYGPAAEHATVDAVLAALSAALGAAGRTPDGSGARLAATAAWNRVQQR